MYVQRVVMMAHDAEICAQVKCISVESVESVKEITIFELMCIPQRICTYKLLEHSPIGELKQFDIMWM